MKKIFVARNLKMGFQILIPGKLKGMSLKFSTPVWYILRLILTV